MKNVSILLVGENGVGKTCLVASYSTGKFQETKLEGIFDPHSCVISLNDNPVNVIIKDCKIRREYCDKLHPLQLYNNPDIILLCYNVVDRENGALDSWKEELKYYQPQTPFILVGTKIDLRKDDTLYSKEENINLANNLGACGYLECSSKTSKGVISLFEESVRIYYNHNILKNTSSNK